MPDVKTMFQLSGRGYPPFTLSNATLLIIDAQKEYLNGPLQLSGIEEAVDNIALLLEAARRANRPVVHVKHLGTVGGLFDPQGERGEFIDKAAPREGEPIIEKRMPNAFNNTGLHEALQNLGGVDLIVCGFMTHSSISTTVRASKDYGYRCTLVEDACATRDLPYKGGVLSAEQVKQVGMATMADNFAAVAQTTDVI
ncbi:cysteine hydrolase family protein [Pseudomonas typographi]|uniref:Cysteine hydrolase n=1 Tax=Pseudomonas typographi TaxID=2715964 RepID=A0ABR7Z0I2_9PSED|nr:cysteine hydrolase family protein [Pseudomonas typographi]MBD1550720.1 cysteine hydrolase [Pseudomonas typographi]MBD1589328.1 cysteine hydrolase [Pseudomonas typographi]MBD1599006.1 cysteine hydrolase [Pseudomonas typographi]